MAQYFAVFGQPVHHSLSPRIHAVFAKQEKIDLSYRAIEASPDDFFTKLIDFHQQGGQGANVTLPHKQAAFVLSESTTERAQAAGAVNTLIRTATGWRGDNTDGIGLIHDLTERHRYDLRGRRTLLLGAGGAAHGVAPSLLQAGIGELFIVNRNADKADQLADQLGEPGRIHSRYWDDIAQLGNFDLIINATSAGRNNGTKMSLPFSLVNSRTMAVDLSYGEAAIDFLAWAKTAKVEAQFDGLGMLVEQAAESFFLWHGVRPETNAIYEMLSSEAAGLHTGD
jgi:shikimate dehydrogenase